MFERYSHKARRVIFFARYEATQYGSSHIESEHLLLAILREDPQLTRQLLGGEGTEDDVRRAIESRIQRRERISTAVDLPLTQECHSILKRAAAEADRFNSQSIEIGHLLLALLAQEGSLAVTVLGEMGVAGTAARNRLLRGRREPREAHLRRVLDALVAAWVQRDLDAFFSFVAEDVRLVDASGGVHCGRESLRLLFPSAKSRFETRRITLEDLRTIRSEVAVVTALCDLADPSELGGVQQVRAGLVLCTGAAEWEIVFAQMTEVWPPAK